MNRGKQLHTKKRQGKGTRALSKFLSAVVAVSMTIMMAMPSGLYASQAVAPSADLVEYGTAQQPVDNAQAAAAAATEQAQQAPAADPAAAQQQPAADGAASDPAASSEQPPPAEAAPAAAEATFADPVDDQGILADGLDAIAIVPFSVITVAPGVVTVDTWDDLRNAIADVTVTEIRLNQNIQRTAGATTWPTDLGVVSRNLTIDGQGHSLDFRPGGANTAINRPGFYLAYQGAGAFTLKNVNIIRPNGGDDSLVEMASSAGSATTAPTDYPNKGANATEIAATRVSSPATGSNWVVNLAGITTGAAPSSGMVLVPAGTVNITGSVNWDCSTGSDPNNCVIFAANTAISGSGTVVTLKNHNASSTVEDMPTIRASSNGVRNSVSVTGGAVANIENLGHGATQAILLSTQTTETEITRPAGTSTYIIASGAGTQLNIDGHGAGIGPEGGTVCMVAAAATNGGGGGFQITDGADVNIRAHSPSGSTGMPAMIQQVDGGQFVLDGEGTELNVVSEGNNNALAGAIRIRLVGNQVFTVSNLAKLYVYRPARSGGFTPPAIRFGDGVNNSFNVTSGGTVRVVNEGTGTVSTSGTEGNNDAIEFSANNFSFDVSGSSVWTTAGMTLSGGDYYAGMKQPSAIEIIAREGAAVAAATYTGGSISVRDGAVFVAEGNVNSNAAGIFSAASPFTFNCDNPLYYDFTNRRANGTTGTMVGGMVFNVTGTSSTFNIRNSNVAVWGNGRSHTANSTSGGVYNPVTGNPWRSWVKVSQATLSSTSFQTLNSSDAAMTTAADSFGSQGMLSYTRISGNNATPQLKDMVELTNADKHVRAISVVPEGLNFAGRAAWDNEVKAYVQRTQANGTVSNNLLAITSVNLENVWEQEVASPNPHYTGVVRYDSNSFLATGDSYKFTDVWRGNATNPNDPMVYHDNPPVIQGAAATGRTVADVTPPTPATINLVDGQASTGRIFTGQTAISGTYPLQEAYNPEEPVAVRAQVVRNGQPVSGLSFDGTLDAQSRVFSVDIPKEASNGLYEGDKIFILLKDTNGKENPIVATPYHDAIFQPGPSLTVEVFPVKITGKNVTIGLKTARDVLDIDKNGMSSPGGKYATGSVDGNLLQLIDAKGTAAPGKNPDTLSVYLVDTQPPFNETNAIIQTLQGFPDAKIFTLTVGSEYQNPGPGHSNLVYSETFTVRVVPMEEVIADDIYISQVNATTLANLAPAPKAAEFIARAKAAAPPAGNVDGANYPGDWTPDNVVFVGTTMPSNPQAGEVYQATFAVRDAPAIEVTIDVYVTSGAAPVLTVPSPINIPIGSPALTAPDYMNGVQATDSQGGADITDKVTNNSATNPVNTNKAGLYPVTYTVTNSDGNPTTATRLYVVNDGTYVVTNPDDDISPDYVLHARNFVVKQADANVNTVNSTAEVEAWRINQADSSGRVSVPAAMTSNSRGYGAGCALGDYPLTIAVTEASNVTRNITATVVNKDELQTGADPTTNIRYSIGANNAQLLVSQVPDYASGNPAAAQNLITLCAAQGWKLTNATEGKPVVVANNPIPATARSGDVFPVTFAIAESPTVTCTVNVSIGGSPPVITFNEEPLVIEQTPGQSHVLTADELKAKMTVTDVEDTNSAALLAATSATVAGNQPINTQNVGVYNVTYSVTDSDGMTATSERAVVVTDGRYIIDKTNNVIIGARNFVIKQADVDGSESQVFSSSYPEAYDIVGKYVPVSLTALPSGWVKNANLGDYNFTWQAQGSNGVWVQKPIVGTVVNADEISPSDKSSRYTIVASNFGVNTTQAAAMVSDASFMVQDRANVRIFPLVTGLAAQTPILTNRGGFSATQNPNPGYPITFAIQGMTNYNVTIRGTVSDGAPPVLNVSTPLEIWIGDAAQKPANAILPVAWTSDGRYGVTVSDADQPTLSVSDVVVSGDTVSLSPDIYKLHYSVTDENGNNVQADRVVVVNDGRYVVGQGRVLLAKSFVTKLADVTSNPNNLNSEILVNSAATLYDGTTGAVVDATSVLNSGGYTKAERVYPITIAGVDVPSGTLIRNITGEVVDRQVIGSGPVGPTVDTYYVFGNNIEKRTSEAQQIISSNSLLSELSAGARLANPNGSLTDAGAYIVNDGGFSASNGAKGIYTVTVADSGNHKSIELTVTVSDGNPPTITATPVPLVIPVASAAGNLSEAQILTGVQVSDIEDTGGVATNVANLSQANRSRFSYTIQETTSGTPVTVTAIPANRGGIYQVTHNYTDADGNPAVAVKRGLLVDDGTVIRDPEYMLKAKSFIIGISEVNTADLRGQIKEKSEALAWKTDGTPAEAYVEDVGGYSAREGEHKPLIGISGYADLKTHITAKVVKTGDEVGDNGYGNGDKYSILAQNFRINITDAKALQAQGASAIAASFVTRANATGLWRAGNESGAFNAGGTPVMTNDGGFRTATFAEKGAADYPTKIPVTFWVDEDHTATCTVLAIVSNGSDPVIKIKDPKHFDLGTPLTDAQLRADVTATDDEDGDITSKITYDTSKVNWNAKGTYEVTYSVTDSDHNTVTKVGYVTTDVIGPPGSNYSIDADSYVVDAATMTGDKPEVITKSKASGTHWLRDADGNLSGREDYTPTPDVIGDLPAGYVAKTLNMAPGYDIRVGTPDPAVYKDIKAFVNGPTDGIYAVQASDATIAPNEVANYVGTGATASANLINRANASATKLNLNTNVNEPYPVAVQANAIPAGARSGTSWDVTFYPQQPTDPQSGPSAAKTVKFTVSGGGEPRIDFTKIPLEIAQTPNSATATQDQLKAEMTANDLEDDAANPGVTFRNVVATPVDGPINTHSIGVYKVDYTVTDADGNTTTATRAVVVTDGRYEYTDTDGDGLNEYIIGARNFVADQKAVSGQADQVRSFSYAEAFDKVGNQIPIELTALPQGWRAMPDPAGNPYPFTWRAVGHPEVTKAITGTVVVADVVDPGTKDSQYAMSASNFRVNLEEAQAILAGGNPAFIAAAQTKVYPLLNSLNNAPLPTITVPDRGGFVAVENNAGYPIRFGAENTALTATIRGIVSQGGAPQLKVTTPLEVAKGGTFNPMDGVTATDTEDDAAGIPLNVTYQPVDSVNTNVVGTYNLTYSVTDSDNNTVTAPRVVVVNDGRYDVGEGRVLRASSFVIKSSDVSATQSGRNAQLISGSQSTVIDGDNGADLGPNSIYVASDGGFSSSVREYNGVILRAPDVPDTQGATMVPLERQITAKVVAADHLDSGPDPLDPNGDSTYVYGNDLTLRVSEMQALLSAADANAAVLNALSAHADKAQAGGGLTDVAVKIKSASPALAAAQGVYRVEVTDVDEAASIICTITVSEGNGPHISAPTPINIPVSASPNPLTRDQLMRTPSGAVTATDDEDGPLTDSVQPTDTATGAFPNIPANVPGVYQVTYKVTDSDGNPAEVTTAVIVNDGSIIYDDKYILRARSFVIGVSQVTPQAADTQILAESNARAWMSNGTLASPYVKEIAGYTDRVDEYTPIIGIRSYDALTRTIMAKVFGDGDDYTPPTNGGGTNGDKYAITANNFRINLTDAAALQTAGAAAIQTEFLKQNRSDAKSLLRATDNLALGGTATLADDGGFRTAQLQEGSTFTVRYAVAEEPGTFVDRKVLVSNATPPWISILKPFATPVGVPLSTAQLSDPAYVDYGDNEDTKAALSFSVDASDVNWNEKNIYKVHYTVVDTDHNTTTKDGTVMVGYDAPNPAGWTVDAENFVKTVEQVTADSSDASILAAAQAKALHWENEDMVEHNEVLVVADRDGYTAAAGDYPIVVSLSAAANAGTPTPAKTISAKVVTNPIISPVPDEWVVDASPIVLYPLDAPNYVGTGNTAKANIITRSLAEGWHIYTPTGSTDSTTAGGPGIDNVDVFSNDMPANPVVGQTYHAVLYPKGVPFTNGVPDVSITVPITINNGNPPTLQFTAIPLVITQTATSQNATQDDLKAELIATDIEDDAANPGVTLRNVVATPVNGIIDKHSIGVYKVSYTVTDSNGNTTTATRPVVIDDGRYKYTDEDGDGLNEYIIGARNFIVDQKEVSGQADQVRSLSYAEAWDKFGNQLNVELAALPAGWQAMPEAKSYPFTWKAVGHDNVTTTITGTVVVADDVDPGTKDSQYGIAASNFRANLQEAAAIVAGGNPALISNGQATVYPLLDKYDPTKTPGAPALPAVTVTSNSFKAEQNANGWPVSFSAANTNLSADILGIVSQGAAPQLSVTTPVEVAKGGTFNPLDGVTVTDPEDTAAGNTPVPTYQPIGDPVDTNVVGIYKLEYSVTDSDNNTVTAPRVVVVNDGRYDVGEGRVLLANSFVIKSSDVSATQSGRNAQLISGSQSTVFDGDSSADLGPNSIYVFNDGGFSSIANTYNGVVLRAPDVPDTQGATVAPLERRITAKVVTADELDSGPDPLDPNADSTYVYGNHLTLRVAEMQALLSAADANAAVLNALSAHADKAQAGGGLTDVAVKIKSTSPALAAAQGVYRVEVTDVDEAASITCIITVSEGNGPAIDAPTPIVIPVSTSADPLTRDKLMVTPTGNVTASDPEDGNLTDSIQPTDPATGAFPNIPGNEPGVYQVTYKVTDSDGNPAELTKAVIVDDGSFVYDDKYILRARSFVIGVSEVTPLTASAQILSESNAQAWKTDGSSVSPYVKESAGYKAVKGTYQPLIGILTYDALTRYITAEVYDDGPGGGGGDNGTLYSVVAYDFRINVQDAAALQAQSDQAVSDAFVARSKAVSYLRADSSLARAGHPTLVNGGEFKSHAPFTEGQTFAFQVAVAEEPGTFVTRTALISDATPPWIAVYQPFSTPVGVPLTTAQLSDQAYVDYGDQETTNKAELTFTVDASDIDWNTKGIYKVHYSVTDPDHNTTTKDGTVAVGMVVGENWVLDANDFVKTVTEVAADSSDASILAAAQAKAWHWENEDLVERNDALAIANRGGYTAAKGDYRVTVTVSDPALAANQLPQKTVDAKVTDAIIINPDRHEWVVAANPITLYPLDAPNYVGTGDVAKANLISRSAAEGWHITTPDGSNDSVTLGGLGTNYVDVLSNDMPANPVAGETYHVVLYPKGVPFENGAPIQSITVPVTISNGNSPNITFTALPLVLEKTATSQPLANTTVYSNNLTASLLGRSMAVTDAEDDAANPVKPVKVDIVMVNDNDTPISNTADTLNVGVYRFRYTATDSNNNVTVAYRAVVVQDGRYVIPDNNNDGICDDIIIGARNFVVKQADVRAVESAIASLSYAEAFLPDGTTLTPALIGGIPPAYAAAALGDHPFVWGVAGHTTTKEINGKVVAADVVDPGDKQSQYAIYASNFINNIEQARATLGNDDFVNQADAHVVKLVTGVPDKSVEINDRGGFTTVAGSYPITFAIQGIPVSSQKAQINGVVTNGPVPVLGGTGPVEIWVGDPADPNRPANSILPSEYQGIKHGVTVTDTDINGAPDLTIDDVQATYTEKDMPAVIDESAVGPYPVHFSVTDRDGNTVTADRVVLVNDGRYESGVGRYLTAQPFVIKANEVTTDQALVDIQLKDRAAAGLFSLVNNNAAPATDLWVSNRGNYSATAATYQVTFSGKDVDPSNSAAVLPNITKTVDAKVVDADVLVSGPDDTGKNTFYVYGNNIVLTPPQAAAIRAAGNAALLEALGAGGELTHANGTLTNFTPIVANDGGFMTATANTGTYLVDIADGNPAHATAQLRVVVATGGAPSLSLVPSPLVVPASDQPGTLTEQKLMEGVTASDPEDDASGTPLAPAIKGDVPQIPADKASVTQVTYTVTDSAGNTIEDSRAVIVDDGSFRWDDKYIIYGNSFLINKADVNKSDPDSQILRLSDAAAWTVDGVPLDPTTADRVTTAVGIRPNGYTDTVGDHQITLYVKNDPSLTRGIVAKVTNKIPGNGDEYSIAAADFRINLADANALKLAGTNAIAADFLTRAGVESYKRSDMSSQAGTKLLSNDGGFRTATFAPEGAADYPSTFPVTFWVDEDHTATVTVTCTVSNGNHPWVTAPPFKQVPLGGSFTEPDYVSGVTYGDSEDDITKLTLIHDTPVDTSREGEYPVTYTVTDSENNSTEAIGYVLVGDDWVFDGDYAVKASNFVTTIKAVQDAASTDALILSRSHAEAKHVVRDAAGNITGIENAAPVVKANGGLTATAGTYPGIQVGVAAATQPIATIQAQVLDKDKISNDPDENGNINDRNTNDPTDPAHYAVAANDVQLTWNQAGQLAGKTDAATQAELIRLAAAEAYKADKDGIRSGLTVAVSANGIQQATGDYAVTFVPAGIGGVAVTVIFSVDQGTMPVITAGPLEVAKVDTPTGMTRAELLEGVTVVDAESPEIGTKDAVITLKDSAGNDIPAIDKSKPGVYQATYTVADPFITNPDGTPATTQVSRAIIVNDGRFILTDEDGDGKVDVIVGAKAFVVSAEDPTFSGTAADALRLSYAEAYDSTGAALTPVLVDPVTGQQVGVPTGFASKLPGTYNFVVSAAGHPDAQRAQVAGTIVFDGTDDGQDHIVIDQGPDPYSSPYALWAKDFSLDVADAAGLAASDAGLIAAADAHVVKLVPTAPDAAPSVIDRDGITDRKGTYSPTFGITGTTPDQYSATVDAVIDDANGPLLTVTTPYEVTPGTPWDRGTAMTGVNAIDPGDGDITDQVNYYPTPDPADPTNPGKPVDTDKPGIYPVTYNVTDSDGNTSEQDRVIVVNDGRYTVGKNNILEATSFVIKAADVTNNATQVKPQLKTMTGAKAYNGKTGEQMAPESINVDSTGGYSRTAGVYDVTLSVTDGAAGRITKTVKAQVIDAEVLDNRPVDPNDPDGAKVHVYANEPTMRISEAARIASSTNPDDALLKAMQAGALITEPDGTVLPQGVKIVDNGGFKPTPGTYTVQVSDLDGVTTIPVRVTVTNGYGPTLNTENPVKIPVSSDPRGLTPEEIKGKATASDPEDGNLTDKIVVTGNVPANTPGIYPVTLTVTDSDNNTVTKKSVVVVDDGGFVYGPNYILHAGDFTVAASSVSTTSPAAQIISRSGAYATNYEGTPAAVSVTSLGGYTNARGEYTPTVAVAAAPSTAKRITATVTSPLVRYYVAFNPNGGALTGPSRIWVVEPSTTLSYLPSSPVRNGYSFVGWFTTPAGSTQFNQGTPVTSNRTVYARWQANPTPTIPPANIYYDNRTTTTGIPGAVPVVINGVGETGQPSYVTVTNPVNGPDDGLTDIGGDTTPLGGPTPTHWSLFDLIATIVAALLLVIFFIKFLLDRRKKGDNYEEQPIDQEQWAKMTPEQRASYVARIESDRKAYYAEQQEKQNKQKALYVNAPVLLIVAAAFVEALIVLLATQDFTAQRVIFDQYSVPISLAVFVQLIAPMIGALVQRRNRGGNAPSERPPVTA
ncbi:MAG: DUF5011 domain-containing protein [Actinomycetia bacterium]|nr:DUF5011 domain-containing protein [Actinomycetes bacterium]